MTDEVLEQRKEGAEDVFAPASIRLTREQESELILRGAKQALISVHKAGYITDAALTVLLEQWKMNMRFRG